MSREIKFRVWHKPEKTMHWYLKAKFGTGTNITLEGKFTDVEHVTTKTVPNGDLEVMQYTGLKDKKGKDIYEGDLVTYPQIFTAPQEVKYAGGCFVVADMVVGSVADKLEVIGNIYENKELLTSG